jgi:tRNA-binding EMAP/Myf-like protein
VLKVEPHPPADRLYVLTLDRGEPQPHSVVAGLKAHYSVSELSSRTVAVQGNLSPRPLRGITSRGMVLAAEGGDVVGVLLTPDGTPPGTRLEGSGEESLPIITHEAFSQRILEVATWLSAPAGDRQGTLETGQGPVPWTRPEPGNPGPVVVRRRRTPTGPVEPL